MIFSAGDITAPLRRGHRRALRVDGWYGQFHRCGESCQKHHQPDCECVHEIIYRVSGFHRFSSLSSVSPFQIEPYVPYEFTCEGMLQRVNVLVERQVGSNLQLPVLSAVATAAFLFRTFSFFFPPLRTFVPTQRAGLHWARSRWSEPPPALPVKPPARSGVWSVNRHSSLTLTVSKAWPSKHVPGNHNLLLHFFVRTCFPFNFGYNDVKKRTRSALLMVIFFFPTATASTAYR